MRTPLDVLRSLQRYSSAILPDPWDVRLALESANPERPFALVTQNDTATPIGNFGAHSLRWQAPFTVHAYLAMGDTRLQAQLAAAGLEEAFLTAFKVRALAPATRGDVVPLWDFVGDHTGGVNPPRAHCDYADIRQFGVRPITDPADPRLVSVAVDLTLAWWRAGSAVDQAGALELGSATPPVDPPTPLRHVYAKLAPTPQD